MQEYLRMVPLMVFFKNVGDKDVKSILNVEEVLPYCVYTLEDVDINRKQKATMYTIVMVFHFTLLYVDLLSFVKIY